MAEDALKTVFLSLFLCSDRSAGCLLNGQNGSSANGGKSCSKSIVVKNHPRILYAGDFSIFIDGFP